MATQFKTPGVYIQEIPKIPAAIAGVATAIPAFVGYTEKAIINGAPWPNFSTTPAPAVRITSILEYQEIFGGAFPETFSIDIDDTPVGSSFTREITPTLPNQSEYNLFYSLLLYFGNGGGPCYVVSVDTYTFPAGTINQSKIISGIRSLEEYDEPTLIAFPDAVNVSTVANYGDVVEEGLILCNKMQDRFVVSDVFGNSTSAASILNFRTEIGMNFLKYGAAYMPFLNSALSFNINLTNVALFGTEVATYTGTDPLVPSAPFFVSAIQNSNPALYNNILNSINAKFSPVLPPSGPVCGIYAQVDRDRGVWKAPANVSVSGINGPTINITAAQQEDLNVDPSTGKSINAIRSFVGKGTLVWGSRTFAGNDNEWRYVPVRRLFIFVEESVKKATEFIVFEPNTANTWNRVKGMIEAFLTGLWRDGALAGATTKDAFFVNVGLGTTMTADDILNGRMIVEIGMAAVRPAEFIILRFEHKLQES